MNDVGSMAYPDTHPTHASDLSQWRDQLLLADAIQIQHLKYPSGEGFCYTKERHTLFMNLTARPIHYVQMQDGKTHTGLYRKGDFTITPAGMQFSARWQGDENCLRIQLSDRFIRSVAQETLAGDSDRLALLPTFQSRDPQIEAIATMFLTELQQEQPGGALYRESLANLLTVHLLRQHGMTQPQLPSYEGGLPPRQLSQVLDYIDTYLQQDIKLADLADLVGLSSFHFVRLFKQSMGSSPHQYLIQQRIERAKRLLQQTDQSIMNVALDCGFNSHSHLSKRFRQLTGMTPKAYRASC
ncbi:helix-turn-helix domain-containing protein [Vacuolonema iberomarrocanum]|uniref:helix-turn-helix domain-containing protein n=1 Tax=Vacuolonema iberomarrocanum TaxID=3454632 RepID=UPI003F6DAA04